MSIPTHCIEIEAKINNNWSEKEIRDSCIKKICFEIDDIWYPELKSLDVNGRTVKVNVLIQSTFYNFMEYEDDIKEDIKTWLNNHITPDIEILKVNMELLGSRLKLSGRGDNFDDVSLEPLEKHTTKNIKIIEKL